MPPTCQIAIIELQSHIDDVYKMTLVNIMHISHQESLMKANEADIILLLLRNLGFYKKLLLT